MEPTASRRQQRADPESLAHARYLRALMLADVREARAVAEAALRAGIAPQRLYLGVFQPALYEIGALWQAGQATIAQEHLATATTQALMARLWPGGQPTADRARCAITAVTEGDWHVLGSRFLADFLEADGWTVLDLGAATPSGELRTLVARIKPAVVCLSTTVTANLPAAERTIAALKDLSEAPLIAVGGHAYGGREALAHRLGADLFALDAGDFLERLAARLQELSPRCA
jgi:methanogenic corrinoid protein MtbC1